MQHCGGADAGSKVLRIGGDGEQSLCRAAEQQVVDHRLILVSDRGDLGRQGKDEVEVTDWQQIAANEGGKRLHMPDVRSLDASSR